MEKTRRQLIKCMGCALVLTGCNSKIEETGIEENDSAALSVPTTEPEAEEIFDPCETQPEEDWFTLNLSELPELEEVGGYTTRNGYVIAHVEEGCYAAVASRCTHEGGEIFYSASRKQFSCLLHAATFDLDGTWALGQITSDLEGVLVAREGDTLYINI